MGKINKVRVKPGPMLYPIPAVMVTTGTMDDSNIITIAWTGIVNSDPPMTYISVKKSRYSHEALMQKREFVINLTTVETTKAADYAGVKSGSLIDKFKELHFTKEECDEVDAPMIAESPVNIECKVTQVIELPSHDMFLSEIVAVHVDDRIIDANGKYRFEDLNFVAYNHGGYYPVRNKALGTFGFSVRKKKKSAKTKKQNSTAKRK